MAAANEDVARLREDFDKLSDDVAALMTSLKEMGVARGREAVDRTRRAGDDLRADARAMEDRAEREIGAHPLTSVLTSFGLGFLIGMLLDRRH